MDMPPPPLLINTEQVNQGLNFLQLNAYTIAVVFGVIALVPLVVGFLKHNQRKVMYSAAGVFLVLGASSALYSVTQKQAIDEKRWDNFVLQIEDKTDMAVDRSEGVLPMSEGDLHATFFAQGAADYVECLVQMYDGDKYGLLCLPTEMLNG